jgi:hypothetical protein
MLDTSSISAPGAASAVVLEQTDPAALSDLDLVAYAQAAERQLTHATAVSWHASRLLAERATARVAGNLSSDGEARDLPTWRLEQMAERAGIDEVRQALHLSEPTTRHRLYRARSLAPDGALAPAGRALAAGLISVTHLLVLLDRPGGLPDHIAAQLQARCLPRASIQTPGNFGKSLVRALHQLDPDGTAAAHRAARARAGVRTPPAEDGMATLTATATEPDTLWAYTVLDTLARAAQHRARASTFDGTEGDSADPDAGVLGTPRREPDPAPAEPDHDGALGQQIVIPPRPVLELPMASDPEPESDPEDLGPLPF